MPNRIIKESVQTSDTLASVSADAERLFWRLVTASDDYGRFHARPHIVLGKCLSAFVGRFDIDQVAAWLDELDQAGLIQRYEVDGEPFLRLPTWGEHQRPPRAKESKFPPPPTDDGKCQRMSADAPVSRDSGFGIRDRDSGFAKRDSRSGNAAEESAPACGAGIDEYTAGKPGGWPQLLLALGSNLPREAQKRMVLDDCLYWAGEMGCDLVERAIRESVEHGAHNWAYVKSCLLNWQEAGAYTLPAVEALIAERKRRRGPRNGARDSPPRQDKLSETRARLRQRIAEERAKEASQDDPG